MVSFVVLFMTNHSWSKYC